MTGLEISNNGGVTTVVLRRSDQRNTIDVASCAGLTELLIEANVGNDIRCIVITGSGRDFCTGADVVGGRDPSTMTTLDYRFATEPYRRLFQALWEVEKPVVSAVNGTVAGAGWMLALLADLVVADRDARWTHVFSRRGMVPHAGDPYFLPRIIGFHRLNEIAMLSDTITSETLAGWGHINRCVGADEVMPTALELATRLAAGPTRSLGMTKKLYRRSLASDLTTAFEDERNATALLSTTHDRHEGVASMIEGRRPNFNGN